MSELFAILLPDGELARIHPGGVIADTSRDAIAEAAFDGGTVVRYVHASELDAARAEVERLRSVNSSMDDDVDGLASSIETLSAEVERLREWQRGAVATGELEPAAGRYDEHNAELRQLLAVVKP